VTKIEIRDPDPGEPEDGAEAEVRGNTAAEGDAPPTEAAESPYRNLLVPLVVVPALIVMVLVAVFALFGAIAGEPPSPEENIETLLRGGRNERDQAAFGLMRQVLEEAGANAESGATSWDIPEQLAGSIRRAWEEVTATELEKQDDVPITLALTVLVAKLGDPAGVAKLAELTRMPASVDSDGEGRFLAAAALGGLNAAGDLPQARADLVQETLLGLLDSSDPGLRQAAAIGLQTLPGEETVAALRGLLAERTVELRLQAALSLAELGDASGEAVLLEMLERAPYEDERARDRRKWSKEARISESRIQALRGLVKLDRTPPPELLARLAEGDDLALRQEILALDE